MDVRTIRQLAEVMDQYQLSELSLEQNEAKVHLVKHAFSGVSAKPSPAVVVPENNAPAAEPAEQMPAEADDKTFQITAPLVGTFYRSANEEAQEYVVEGAHVEQGSVVCIIEAMKVMNEIKTEKSGTITRVLVENGTPVEFGQALFELKED